MNEKDQDFVRRWTKKTKAINLLGGRCSKCGMEICSDDKFRFIGSEEAKKMRPEFHRDQKL